MTIWTSPSEPLLDPEAPPFSRAEFEARLREKERFYHIHHPFQVAMAAGELEPDQIRGWVLNRFYYQLKIPQKDAAILANCPDREVRRHWVQRILDHDGIGDDPGGIEAWVQLGLACGLQREDVTSQRHVLPGVRFAVDAYVTFARQAGWEEAVVSSLTELFAPKIHRQRLSGWPELYPWIAPEGLAYFQKRLSEARRDVEHGLEIALDRFRTRPDQERVLSILQFKLDILWSMLDAMWMAYVERRPPYFNVSP